LIVAADRFALDDLKLVWISALASAVAALLLVVVPGSVSLILLSGAIGLFNSALWPTIMAAAGARFPQMPGTVLGATAGGGALGWMLLQPAVGYVARLPVFESEAAGLHAGMLLPVLCFVGLAACAAHACRASRARK
jgi:fucose permease